VRPELRRIGKEQSPLVVIDEFSGDAERIAQIAERLAPFPEVKAGYYPGVRRFIGEADSEAWDYVAQACQAASPFIGGAFNFNGFYLVESSFSLVTTGPEALVPAQRAPHFDSPDQKYLAVLHYLRVPAGTGTAFYRHKSTGIERVTNANVDRFVHAAKADAAKLAPDSGYIQGSDEYYEQIAKVEALPDRLVIYQGSLIHSGIIPPDMPLTPDPAAGRLTANIFVHGR
jgi:hypothetical protein